MVPWLTTFSPDEENSVLVQICTETFALAKGLLNTNLKFNILFKFFYIKSTIKNTENLVPYECRSFYYSVMMSEAYITQFRTEEKTT
jgi:hypothetical protein